MAHNCRIEPPYLELLHVALGQLISVVWARTTGRTQYQFREGQVREEKVEREKERATGSRCDEMKTKNRSLFNEIRTCCCGKATSRKHESGDSRWSATAEVTWSFDFRGRCRKKSYRLLSLERSVERYTFSIRRYIQNFSPTVVSSNAKDANEKCLDSSIRRSSRIFTILFIAAYYKIARYQLAKRLIPIVGAIGRPIRKIQQKSQNQSVSRVGNDRDRIGHESIPRSTIEFSVEQSRPKCLSQLGIIPFQGQMARTDEIKIRFSVQLERGRGKRHFVNVIIE